MTQQLTISAREQVWHEGQFELVPDCVTDTYIRHDQKGDRTVSRETYAAEIDQMRQARPGTRVVTTPSAVIALDIGSLSSGTSRTTRKVFFEYSVGDEYAFNKTTIPLTRAKCGANELISRS